MQALMMLVLFFQSGSNAGSTASDPYVEASPRQEAGPAKPTTDEGLRRVNASLNRQIGKLEAEIESLGDDLEVSEQLDAKSTKRAEEAETRARALERENKTVSVMRSAAIDRLIEARRDLEEERSYAKTQNYALFLLMFAFVLTGAAILIVARNSKAILARVPDKTTAARLAFHGQELERISGESTRLLLAEKQNTYMAMNAAREGKKAAERWRDACRLAEEDAAKSALWSQDRLNELMVASDALVAEMRGEMDRAQRQSEQELGLRQDQITGLRHRIIQLEDDARAADSGSVADFTASEEPHG